MPKVQAKSKVEFWPRWYAINSRVTLYIATKSDVSDALFSELEEKCTASELSSDDESSTLVKELLVPTFLPKPQTSEPNIKEVDSKEEESFVSEEEDLFS